MIVTIGVKPRISRNPLIAKAQVMFYRRGDLKAVLAAALLMPLLVTPLEAQQGVLVPSKPGWKVKGNISKDKEMSGIACIVTGKNTRKCLVAVDEGNFGLFISLTGRVVEQDDKIRLAPEVSGEELDAEGVAYDPATTSFYVIGSYGKPRHSCSKDNPSASRLVRIPVSSSTGRPSFDYKIKLSDPAWVPKEVEAAQELKQAMTASAQIGPYVDQCLASDKAPGQKAQPGANVEGLAVYKSSLFVGFRGPVHGDTAYLLMFDRDAAFKEKHPRAETVPLRLGNGIGVRDLAAVDDGLLILSGPMDDIAGDAAIYHFEPSSRVLRRLGTLPNLTDKAKPEGLLVLQETATSYDVLVLSDSADNGAPAEFSVPK